MHTTIKVWLSAVRHMHVIAGLHDLFSEQLTPCLQLVLCGIKKSQASTPSRVRLPITLELMQNIRQVLFSQPHSYTNIMLWATCCLAFFGFLCVSEFTIPTDYDPSLHLSMQDIAIDHRDNPSILKVIIKQSKTDPFRQGVQIYIPGSNTQKCMSHTRHPAILGTTWTTIHHGARSWSHQTILLFNLKFSSN